MDWDDLIYVSNKVYCNEVDIDCQKKSNIHLEESMTSKTKGGGRYEVGRPRKGQGREGEHVWSQLIRGGSGNALETNWGGGGSSSGGMADVVSANSSNSLWG